MKKYYCIDCGKELSKNAHYYNSKRCKSCAHAGILSHFFKHGKACKSQHHFCIDCKTEITDYKAKRCCSCAGTKSAKLGTDSPNYKGGFPNCQDCGKMLTRRDTKRCQECYLKTIKGENHPMFGIHRFGEQAPTWQGGISFEPYTLEWTDNLRKQIRKRDDYICQNPECNITEEEHVIKFKRILTVHHIDYDKQNCKPSNLITVCMNCNTKANYNRDYWYAYFRYIMERE